jgi:hypothetical protein
VSWTRYYIETELMARQKRLAKTQCSTIISQYNQ